MARTTVVEVVIGKHQRYEVVCVSDWLETFYYVRGDRGYRAGSFASRRAAYEHACRKAEVF
ncbi:MAG: hypothetical protein ACKVQQ_14390 [Burkholderiales bacterium]